MNRYEQEYYKDIAKIAKELEIANKIKILELSGELKGLSLKGIKNKI